MFDGITCALATPFLNNQVHFDSLVRLVNYQKDNGVNNFLVCGTTGEAPLLTEREKDDVVRCVKDSAFEHVLLGVESPSTWECLKQMELVCKYNLDGVVVVGPYFSKGTHEGVIEHFLTLANEGIKLYLYNVPTRTSFDISPSIVKELAKHPNIVGLQEASGDLVRAMEYTRLKNFDLLGGVDELTSIFKSIGAKGMISALCNSFPRWAKELWQGKTILAWQKACKVAFCETNPVVIKYMLKRLDVFVSDECRTPLSKATAQSRKKVDKLFKEIEF